MTSRPSPRPFARESPERLALLRRGLLLEYATLGWNVIGTVVVVAAAFRALSKDALDGGDRDAVAELVQLVLDLAAAPAGIRAPSGQWA